MEGKTMALDKKIEEIARRMKWEGKENSDFVDVINIEVGGHDRKIIRQAREIWNNTVENDERILGCMLFDVAHALHISEFPQHGVVNRLHIALYVNRMKDKRYYRLLENDAVAEAIKYEEEGYKGDIELILRQSREWECYISDE